MEGRQAPDDARAGTRFAAWCLLLVLPLWLLGVAVIGYGKDRNCTSEKIDDAGTSHRPRPAPAELAECLGPSWKSPLHGLAWPPGDIEVAWAVVTVGAGALVAVGWRRTRPF